MANVHKYAVFKSPLASIGQIVTLVLGAVAAMPAHAGPASDALKQCLIYNSSQAERATIARNVAVDVLGIKLSAADKAKLIVATDAALDRLLDVCKMEFQTAVARDGLDVAGEATGQFVYKELGEAIAGKK